MIFVKFSVVKDFYYRKLGFLAPLQFLKFLFFWLRRKLNYFSFIILDMNALWRQAFKAPVLIEDDIFLRLEQVKIFATGAHNKFRLIIAITLTIGEDWKKKVLFVGKMKGFEMGRGEGVGIRRIMKNERN